ncbi:hypothetical protein NO1_1812 [Candidatus Termititenax aidoneus]|uniref:Uncharacterized protein n=1 Tax=Termititenax aidoneus TaxID=2218524 RepID=A0A388TDM7_TERA1|nr:hypothetical protein NO1_1812 [Candidatus Termititenax aidoneus]
MEISIYSKSTDDELKKLHEQFSAKYGAALQDDARSLEDRQLIRLVAKKIKQPDKQTEEIHSVQEFIKEYLYRKLKELALLIYLAMDKCKDFGPMGEQRVSISFCRNVLNISNNREVTQFDADRFRRLLDECDKRNGVKSGDAYLAYLKKDFVLELFGIKYGYLDLSGLNLLFDLIGLGCYLLSAHHRSFGVRFIFGAVEKKELENNQVFIIQQEYIRAPQFVLSIAAEVFQDSTMIRREACEVIFFNKWQKFFDQSKAERKHALHHVNSALREGVKEKALAFYAAQKTEDVLKVKEIFIEEMIDGILWHEMGHHVSFQDMGQPYRALVNTFTEGAENIGAILPEALADWAPEQGARKGAFTRFLELSKTDVRRAARDLYVYISDNWFVDESEEFMSLMSNILAGLAVYFVQPDGAVDFARLSKEKDQIYSFLQKRYKGLIDRLLAVFQQSIYEVGIHRLDYNGLEKEVFKMYQNAYAGHRYTMEELRAYSPFWINITAYLKKFSKANWEKYQEILAEEADLVEKMILRVVTKGQEEKYKNSLREYIITRAKELGLIQILPEIDSTAAVRAACAAMKMPDAVLEKVQARFTEIMNDKPYEISISYDGEKDPFIAAVQEMLLKSGYGSIKSGMLIGEYYNPESGTEERKQYIKNELESLRDQLESEMYLEIDILRVNGKYPAAKPIIEELLQTVTFLDGRKLAEKIKNVEFSPLDNDALLEVFVPLKRGYMDWNTSQAVWRINQDLRPDEFMLQWTIDRDFLEALIEAYS